MSLVPIYRFGDPEVAKWINRFPSFDPEVPGVVAQILADVRKRGGVAVLESARRFDCPELSSILLDASAFDNLEVSDDAKNAIRTAIRRVTEFHETQLGVVTNDWDELPDGWGWRTDVTDRTDTGFEGQRMLPIKRAGIYLPGGLAAYPSSAVMNVVPAKVAGVKEVVVATPARKDGTIHPLILFALQELGVETVIVGGGAAAIGALAFGIEGCPRVDLIAGPGNSYVNEAKRQLWGSVGLDGFAGPSEVAVVVDGSVPARLSAADLLTQIEHAPDNVGVLVGTSEEAIRLVLHSCESILMSAPRAEIMSKALSENGAAILIRNLEEAAEFINLFAPEHASLHVDSAADLAMKITNCGCVMIGDQSAQSAGDYCSGPSHTLPTGGGARFSSPLSVTTFLKTQSISMLTKGDMDEMVQTIDTLARIEGFEVHALGATVRGER